MNILSPILKKLQDKYKYKFIDEIGRGVFSEVFDIGNNRVLKITKNKQEAIAASIIKGRFVKNIVLIYRVFTVASNKNHNKYYIEMEKLVPIKMNEEYDDFYEYLIEKQNQNLSYIAYTNNLVKNSNNPQETQDTLNEFNDDEKDFIGYMIKDIPENYDNALLLEKIALQIRRHKNQINDLINGLKELKAMGIDFYDIHSNNIMKSNSAYKFVDISWHQQGEKIEILEQKVNFDNKVKYATTPEQKHKGLRNIELEDWSGLMVFSEVKPGDVFVGQDCLFDIRIAFLDASNKVLSIGVIEKDTGRVIAPENTVKAIETAESDDYQIIVGNKFIIPARHKFSIKS